MVGDVVPIENVSSFEGDLFNNYIITFFLKLKKSFFFKIITKDGRAYYAAVNKIVGLNDDFESMVRMIFVFFWLNHLILKNFLTFKFF